MYFFSVFCIFVSAIILVQCQEFVYDEGPYPHKYTDIQDCDNKAKEIQKNTDNVVVKPRDRLVVLKPPKEYEYKPSMVIVKRCQGNCPTGYSPMPTANITKSFTVKLHHERKKIIKCVSVHVEEHTKCGSCTCIKVDCDSKIRDWDEANCNCQCKLRDKNISDCNGKKPEMVWDDRDCSCKCPAEITQCGSGQRWNKEECKCKPMKSG